MVLLQPCDWHEHDVSFKVGKTRVQEYVVDVYGRTQDDQVACVRITGFSPYFYCGGADPGRAVQVKKYDVFAGFNDLAKTNMWKVSCATLNEFHEKKRSMADRALYESDLPPFLRLIHEHHRNAFADRIFFPALGIDAHNPAVFFNNILLTRGTG